MFRERFEGSPIKNVAVTIGDATVRGEPTITATGLEGGPIYALGTAVRHGARTLTIDLQPDLTIDRLRERLERRRPRDSHSTWMRKAGFAPVEVAVLREATANQLPLDAGEMAGLAKAVTLPIEGLAPMERAISTAGGVAVDELDATGMLRRRPGWWVAGEMVAWDAPTGGYLLQACLSTGRAAGLAAARRAVS